MTEAFGTEPRLVGGRYELGEVLGYGGMAEVYRGRDVRLGREVAVKALRADLARDPTFLARFRREAQSSAALNHPAIVSVYDTGEDLINGTTVPYIVMEYVEGRTLRDVLQQEGRFSERRAMEITSDVCAALDYSHRMGIIHRDIKPANVMLCQDGSVKVMDFGIARATTATTSNMTQTAAVIGTAQYLSPEQARGVRVDARSDVYSTGVLFYELLTGQPPFRGDSPVAVAYQHVRENPQPPSSHDRAITPNADAIVFKAMEKDPDHRYSTAGLMRDDLERALAGRPIYAPQLDSDQLTTRLGASPAVTAGTHMISRGRGPYDDGPDDPYGRTGAYDRTGGYGTGGYDRAGFGGPGGGDSGPLPEKRRSDAWKYILAGLSVVAVFVVVTMIATNMLGGGGGNGGNTTADTATIPTNLIGQKFETAKNSLSSAGFTNIVSKVVENNEPKDLVVEVDPAPGTAASKSAPITLSISKGPGDLAVPDVAGLTQAAATAKLKEAGLTVKTSAFTDATTRRAGLVESSDPAAGTSIAPGEQVIIYVVSTQATVPNVTDQPVDPAKIELERYGFRVVQQAVASSKPTGTVVSQSPGGGSAARGSTVTLYVAQQQAINTQTPTPSPSATATPSKTPSPSPSSTGGGLGGLLG
ncbi:serine/threonine protein kinase [Protofrankia sp. BMG5.30]|uniref:non-specific serine/threonine protein kinase n=1 Tax=Protofrankia coriariae TaxID=1562887 RepID=A0ABR5F267_9ACTN|nr:Stk1 family PASTA domain-containing Ser/Thr kinase [Protofrankia coriariae]KLL10767.1 serine/threonine protein kinase [Protofrankia coriariae]ONH33012.1 serine/threonine protein kinase [Protofrankia sp. BMG5.30]